MHSVYTLYQAGRPKAFLTARYRLSGDARPFPERTAAAGGPLRAEGFPKRRCEGTWGLQEVEKIELGGGKGEFYNGSVKITWDCPADTKLNIDFGGGLVMPMDVKEQILPLMNNIFSS